MNSKLILTYIVMFSVMVGVAINDISINSRKGIFSHFIYVNDFDEHNLQFLKYIAETNLLIVGAEASTYSWHLNIVYDYQLLSVSSMKITRDIYAHLYESSGSSWHLNKLLLLASIKELGLRHILILLDKNFAKIYDSDTYTIHYVDRKI